MHGIVSHSVGHCEWLNTIYRFRYPIFHASEILPFSLSCYYNESNLDNGSVWNCKCPHSFIGHCDLYFSVQQLSLVFTIFSDGSLANMASYGHRKWPHTIYR